MDMDQLYQHAVNCAADVALWPQWKRNSPAPTPTEVPNKEILRAASRRIYELIANLQVRQNEYPFPELEETIDCLHQALVRIEEELIPTCGKGPLGRLAATIMDDD